jgi:hypothetical protein
MSEVGGLMHADMNAYARELAELRQSVGRNALVMQRHEQALRLIAFRTDTIAEAKATARMALHPHVRP